MKSSHYIEVQPERDVSGDNFSKGEINFNWSMDSSGYYNPYKSFIKLRFKLYKRVSSADASLEARDSIAPNMFMAHNLFQQVKQNINSVCVSEVSDYVPQVASLRHRMYKTEEHMNNYLANTNFSQADLTDRVAQVASGVRLLESPLVKPSLGGTVDVTAPGVITLSTAHPDLQAGDTIVLKAGHEIHILEKTNDTTFLTYVLTTPIAVGGKGVAGWSYKSYGGSRDVRTMECIFKPGIGFYDIDEFIPGCQALCNLKLTPQPGSVFKLCAVETGRNATVTLGLTSDTNTAEGKYLFSVESMNMYVLKGIGEPVKNKSLTLSMREIRCQSQNITTNSLHQKTFQVHPNTQELTMAYQFAGASVTDNRFSASKFRCNNFNSSGADTGQSDELKIRRFWVDYGGRQLPTPIPDTQLSKTSNIDYLVQRYVETLNYTNSLHSPEPLRKWYERGIYFHFSGYSADEKEDRCFVSSQFDDFADSSVKPNVLLFDHYIKKVAINIENHIVQDVREV